MLLNDINFRLSEYIKKAKNGNRSTTFAYLMHNPHPKRSPDNPINNIPLFSILNDFINNNIERQINNNGVVSVIGW